MSLASHIVVTIRRKVRRFVANTDGIAAIEFALIAPVMLLFYFGLAEVSLLISADRKTSHAASLIGDLAAQDTTLDLATGQDLMGAVLAVLGTNPEQSSRIGVELYSFEAVMADTDGDGDEERDVQEIGFLTFGPAYEPGAAGAEDGRYDGNNVEERLLVAGGGVVVARVVYEYQSPYRYFVREPRLREVFLLKPRRSATVTFENGNLGGTDKSRREISCTLTSTNPNTVDCQPL
ncbi:TadE/TadG family type IV pilus assembly protein [Robiginitomaculum antarcticum]|uniref:TadE/TadG family type IV pilus assembly protein n=1 Tax=Robiginitomaculum antarcticum TaxID=437507 RepID=UPI000381AFEB|nr:TadE/TadG family type IV pilus assembly protein [Robiginitomaculum antarcticum]